MAEARLARPVPIRLKDGRSYVVHVQFKAYLIEDLASAAEANNLASVVEIFCGMRAGWAERLDRESLDRLIRESVQASADWVAPYTRFFGKLEAQLKQISV